MLSCRDGWPSRPRVHRRRKVDCMISSVTAQELSEAWLSHENPRRWHHVLGVGRKAKMVSKLVLQECSVDREVLVAAAYLHDIGYASGLRRTGLHQLDGARFVRGLGDERLACLVAHHSEA